MEYITAKYTDVGTRKKTNQDSMLLMQAKNDQRRILMAAVCDGMGGLAKGELASATMVRALSGWFETRLPRLLEKGFSPDDLWDDWGKLVEYTNITLADYARARHTSLGTTAAVLLLIDNLFYWMNVGDSRIYILTDTIRQMTKDQTVVQREMDAGRMTYEESLQSPDRSVLLQCVGASPEVHPDYMSGIVMEGQEFLLCSDGFRHVILPEELYLHLDPRRMLSEEIMEGELKKLTELNLQRNEDDNISAVLIKTC